jgi:hypothetical protein
MEDAMRSGFAMMTATLLALAMTACGGSTLSQSTNGNAATNAAPDAVTPPPDQRKADYVSFEGGLRAYPEKKRVEMDAHMLSEQTRPLEFLLVAPGGATHESLFAAQAKGEHLKRALEIIGLKEGAEKRAGRGYHDKPVGDRVKISVRFKHSETGKETVVRVEDWLTDFRLKSKPEPVGWIFTGSYEQYKPELNRSIVEADLKGNLIGLWRDASCVLDNDRDSGVNSDVYSPNPDAPGIPKPNGRTPAFVTLIFEPHE